MSERGSCRPEGCSGYDRARAGGTSASPPPGASPPPPGSSAGEAAVSRPPDGDVHMPFLVLHEERHASCQADRSQERGCLPDRDQCLLHCRANQGRPVPVQTFRGASDQHLLSQEIPLSCLVQDTGSRSPAGARPLTEIIQHHRLPGLPCLQICLCLDHRELHSCCSVLVRRTSTLLSSFTSIFS
jgi:hypothetical protein